MYISMDNALDKHTRHTIHKTPVQSRCIDATDETGFSKSISFALLSIHFNDDCKM